MSKMSLLAGACAAALLTVPASVSAETFRYAFQGDVQSLDPHGLNETFTLGYLGNVYEGMTSYDSDLQIQPGLAESWENTEPTVWRFVLRQGVTFHDGEAFDAEDVVFSWQRTLTAGSDMKGYGAKISDIRVIDPHTIELVTPTPNPILPRELVYLYIMDKGWSEANGAVEATSPSAAASTATYAAQNANGTGPFRLVERQADVRSRLTRFEDYWKDIPTNVTEVLFTPIAQDATRVAALISGELDMAWPIGVQDWPRLESAEGVSPLSGPEARTIFLGFDHFRDELLYSSVTGANPLKDVRVREAIIRGVNLQAINERVMRGAATPTGLLVGPQINGFPVELNDVYAYDPERSQELLAEAGYPDGFQISLDCPNDRYVNDEQICQAVVGLLARVGITVNLNALPKARYFAKVSPQSGNDTSFYLLGWTPSTMDSHNALFNLLASYDTEKNSGQFNYGHYSNSEIDELTDRVVQETDQAERQRMIEEAMRIAKEDYAYLPLHQQPLSWGVRDGVELSQRADDVLDLRTVVVGTN